MNNKVEVNEREIQRNKRRKLKSLILTWTISVLGFLLLTSLFVGTILDLPAFTRFSQYSKEIHAFTDAMFTSCLGFLCLILGFERRSDFDNIEATFENQNKKLGEILKELNELQGFAKEMDTQNVIKRIQRIGERNFDPILNDLFNDFIDDKIHSLIDGIEDKKITFDERDTFEKAYFECLEKFKHSHFMATSLADPNYFWTKVGEDNSPIENRIAEFINSGGQMTRIFFVEPTFLENEDTISVLKKQLSLNVNVFTVSNVPPGNQRYFIIDDRKQISWRFYTDGDKKIMKFVCSANERDIKKYHDNFKKLQANRTCKEYKPIKNTRGG